VEGGGWCSAFDLLAALPFQATKKESSDPLVMASALEKGIYCGGQAEHHPTAARAQLTRVMRDIKLSGKLSAETLQGESRVVQWIV